MLARVLPAVTIIALLLARAYVSVRADAVPGGQLVAALLDVACVLAFGWLATVLVGAAMRALGERLARRTGDPQRLRRIRTQLSVFRTVATAVVWLIAGIVVMLLFPATRAIATTLSASAGLLTLVAGIAAQGTLGSLFAGIQIAFGDVVRIGDTVVIDEQRGVIEEIALTYVVVRLADDRHLVVPVTFFTTKSFENWSRKTALTPPS
ncbi:mechanosensitive ion channel family protein [Nocardia yamanashiensis]|uniref:mechanosensitive ion channel family protein n=1 Tax=Nocardia yamanashiensis TaxID=209247 RepID=UPI001E508BBD|nr:mechanosensitive ion channel domain-containing protein [Nocardia yamanashiensis]UGT42668.1 mechanosensitive ion channel family protein [Nocardia yamanashiensis]